MSPLFTGTARTHTRAEPTQPQKKGSIMTETTVAQAPLADTSEQFKLAFGHQPAGVAIITATDENGDRKSAV